MSKISNLFNLISEFFSYKLYVNNNFDIILDTIKNQIDSGNLKIEDEEEFISAVENSIYDIFSKSSISDKFTLLNFVRDEYIKSWIETEDIDKLCRIGDISELFKKTKSFNTYIDRIVSKETQNNLKINFIYSLKSDIIEKIRVLNKPAFNKIEKLIKNMFYKDLLFNPEINSRFFNIDAKFLLKDSNYIHKNFYIKMPRLGPMVRIRLVKNIFISKKFHIVNVKSKVAKFKSIQFLKNNFKMVHEVLNVDKYKNWVVFNNFMLRYMLLRLISDNHIISNEAYNHMLGEIATNIINKNSELEIDENLPELIIENKLVYNIKNETLKIWIGNKIQLLCSLNKRKFEEQYNALNNRPEIKKYIILFK